MKNYENYDRPRPSRKHFSPRFFEAIRTEYKDSFSSPELYKKTFVHFMLGGEAASDIGADGNFPLNRNRTGGLLNADWESRLKAADALNHPWIQNHAMGVVCNNTGGTIMMPRAPQMQSQGQGSCLQCGHLRGLLSLLKKTTV